MASYPTKMDSSSTPQQIPQNPRINIDHFLLHPLTCFLTFHSFSSCCSFTDIAIVVYVVSFTGVEMQIRPADIVAALFLDSTAAEAVTPLLHAQNIAPVLVPLEAFAAQRMQLSSESSKVRCIF